MWDYLKLAAFLLLLAAITYVMLFTPTGALFRTAEGRRALVGSLDALVQSAGPLGPVVFVLDLHPRACSSSPPPRSPSRAP